MLMMMKQEPTTPIPTACGNCGVEERRLLHHVRHRGIFRRLCTSCVLKLHPQSFCPTCFLVYDRSPPSNDTIITCFKCYSSSHSHCVGSNVANPYVCPLCASLNAPIFSAKKAKDGDGEGGDGNCRVIDKNAARVLLAAARIAAVSTSKAAVTARTEAERRAKEAAFARKRAREALEHVAFLVAKEKLKRKELPATATAVQNPIGNQRGAEGVDGASEVLASLNAVELREREKSNVFRSPNNCVPMGVEDNERLIVNPVSHTGGAFVQNHGTGNENERSGNLDLFENHNAEGGKLKNGIVSVSPVGDQLHHMQTSHGREENVGSQQ